jgi:hypothetical protein
MKMEEQELDAETRGSLAIVMKISEMIYMWSIACRTLSTVIGPYHRSLPYCASRMIGIREATKLLDANANV